MRQILLVGLLRLYCFKAFIEFLQRSSFAEYFPV
jgi:hypothetical protein